MTVREFACESEPDGRVNPRQSDVAPFITSSERMHIPSDCPALSLKTSWEGSHRPLPLLGPEPLLGPRGATRARPHAVL
jgi:hypothetical protein